MYLIFREREGKGGRMIGRETLIDCLSQGPSWETGLQARLVPWPGIKLVTLQFTGQCSIHWEKRSQSKKKLEILRWQQQGITLSMEFFWVQGLVWLSWPHTHEARSGNPRHLFHKTTGCRTRRDLKIITWFHRNLKWRS